MIRNYFCQTATGLNSKDRFTVDTEKGSDKIVVGFESETAPCAVWLNESQIVNLIELLTAWLQRDDDVVVSRPPKLWEDA